MFNGKIEENVVISNEITTIKAYSFYGCTSIKTIELGNSVTIIEGQAFYGCTGLEKVIIPKSVVSIGDWAFSDCTNLTIYCKNSSKPSGWTSNWNRDWAQGNKNTYRPVKWGVV